MGEGVRVRFAPSPTGVLHVGSARTALFNWFWAQRHRGTLILRIEDTDQKRSKEEYLQQILASLAWLGIVPDEGPYFQRERIAVYREHAQRLLDANRARHEAGAVIFRIEPQQLTFDDLIHGPITFDTTLLEDLVLIKADGLPTYNFACVVDDALMQITQVIRGDDHIANTPKQLLLYHALGYQPPQFAHIPLIVDAERARLSKRTGAQDILELRDHGLLPSGVVNYLALLGWSPGGNREVMTPREIIEWFDIRRIKKTAAQFDPDKLEWLNGLHIKQLPPPQLLELLRPRLQQRGWSPPATDGAWLLRVVTLMQERIKTLEEFEALADFFFVDDVQYQPQAVEEFLQRDGVAADLGKLRERLATTSAFDPQTLETVTRQFVAERGTEAKTIFHPVRVAITGRSVSPRLFETMALIGKERVLTRLAYAATHLAKGSHG